MAEEIVACPSCAKKFRIPEGAPPGSFPCTACEADVPYGAPPAKAASKGPARPAPAQAKPKAPAPAARPAAAAPAKKAAPAPAAAPARRAAPAPAARRPARPAPEAPAAKGPNHALIWGGIGLGVAVIGLVYFLTRSTPPETPAGIISVPKPADTSKPAPPAPKPDVPAPAPTPEPSPSKPEAPVAQQPTAPEPKVEVKPDPKPDPKVEPKKPAETSQKPRGDYAMLGQTVPSVTGTTEADRSDMDRLVTLVMDLSSGKDGAVAESKLLQAGKKAIPPLLSSFSKQFTGGKWSTEAEQYGAFQVQQLLRRIVRQDGPNSDFVATFMPGGLSPAEDFEKAATMWFEWWNAKGQFKEKFKASND